MTQDTRIDRLEGMMERVTAELSEIRQDMRDMRAETRDLRTDMESKFRTLLLVNVGLWATTVGSIIGLFFKGS